MRRLILTGLLAASVAAGGLTSQAAYAGEAEQYVPLPPIASALTRRPARFGGPAKSIISATSTKLRAASTALSCSTSPPWGSLP
jgi:hypothetical protein